MDSISSLIFSAIIPPIPALLALIGYYGRRETRGSLLAFCLVAAGVVAVAYWILLIAFEASAAV